MTKVALITNIAAHYKEPLWKNLLVEKDIDFHFFFGKKNESIKSIDFSKSFWQKKSIQQNLNTVKNFYIGKRLIFQYDSKKKLFASNWDVIILLGDPNVLSTWLISFYAKIKKTPIVFWGHGIYSVNENFKFFIRKKFLKLANHHLLYGNYAKNLMISCGFESQMLSVIYNSLDYENSFKYRVENFSNHYFYQKNYFPNKNPVLIFIGRLTPQKKLSKLFQAVKLLKDNSFNFNLLIVGKGPEEEKLKALSNKLSIPVYFHGAEYEEKIIAELISNSQLCISPGEIGLTAIHSLSYGTPVCTHNNFKKQMPEFESIIEYKTGIFYSEEKDNLSDKILEWFKLPLSQNEIKLNCYSVIDKFYNPNYQLKILKRTIKYLAN